MKIARSTLLSLLLFPFAVTAGAVPVITSLTPATGFTFANTTVTISGDFGAIPTGVFNCQTSSDGSCPVRVFFGGQEAAVIDVASTQVRAIAPPHAAGTVDVRVTDPRSGDGILPNAFRYAEDAVTTPADYVQYLVPLATSRVQGAYGSSWTSELTVLNTTSVPVTPVWNYCQPNVSPCPPPFLQPQSASKRYIGGAGDGREGAFIYVPKFYASSIALAERVRDESKNAGSYGTEIPVVRVAGDFTSFEHPVANLIDIPTDARYRAMLRIYSAADYPITASVQVRSQDTGAVLSTEDVALAGVTYLNGIVPPLFPMNPAYAQRDLLTAAVRGSAERIRITVEARAWNLLISPTPVLPVYAFVSITNNDTQQVTVVTPSR